MLDKILVPLDESPLAESVLPHVMGLAQLFNARVTLMHVLENEDPPDQQQVDPLSWQLRKAEAQAYLESVKARLQRVGLTAVDVVLLEGTAAQRITEYVRQHEITLLVMSTHGQSGLSGWNVSSVVQKVLVRCYCSIMIVRAYEQGDDEIPTHLYHRLLVPLDGSQRAEHVLPIATILARQDPVELLLAHVVTRPVMFQRAPLTPDDNRLVEQFVQRNMAEAEKYLEQLRHRLSVDSKIILRIANSVTVGLHTIIDEEAPDLVLVSAHGFLGDRQRAYGSVTTNLINYGKSSLLIIQDLSAEDIEPTPAEIAARQQITRARTLNHVQFNG